MLQQGHGLRLAYFRKRCPSPWARLALASGTPCGAALPPCCVSIIPQDFKLADHTTDWFACGNHTEKQELTAETTVPLFREFGAKILTIGFVKGKPGFGDVADAF